MLAVMKPVLAITLTEKPLLRSFLFYEKGRLIDAIAQEYQVKLLLSNDTHESALNFLSSKSQTVLDGVEAILVSRHSPNLFERFFSFLLRYMESSDGNLRLRHLLHEQGKIGKMGLLLRNSISFICSKNAKAIKMVRYLLSIAISNEEYRKLFKSIQPSRVLVTSLTNFNYDAPLLTVARKMDIKTIGTPRSWDNLVSHGSLHELPDLFLSHSTYMTECAMKYQFIPQEQISNVGVSTYRKIENVKSDRKVKFRVGLGCVGPSHPSEVYFLKKCASEVFPKYPWISFFIVQHPKFLHTNLPDFSRLQNVNVVSFPFDCPNEDTLESYYDFLTDLDLMFTSGSTIGLDALYCGIPIICNFFDVSNVPFWASSGRFLTHRTHYKDLIQRMSISCFLSFEDFLNFFENYTDIVELEIARYRIPTEFTGTNFGDFTKNVMNSLKV